VLEIYKSQLAVVRDVRSFGLRSRLFIGVLNSWPAWLSSLLRAQRYQKGKALTDKSSGKQEVIEAYLRRAPRYDLTVRLFDVFATFGFNIAGWRKQAVSALNLKPGDTVVDIGCGTGLNFPFLYREVASHGKIICIDLSAAMLVQAKQLVAANQWTNVQLVCADAAQFEFPLNVDAVLSAYTLTLVPDCRLVVSNAYEALDPGGRIAVLDMAWPRNCPLWWRHFLFFLRSYGVTAEVLRRRPWEVVQSSMMEMFQDFSVRHLWFGFFYIACGIARQRGEGAA
jgi:ubiquinone/menaquinone biosynthesis C-methylase UbiE